jgi:hypothetical protein
MTDPTVSVAASDTITVMEGFDAMRIFLTTVLRRHGKTPEEIAFRPRWIDMGRWDPGRS